MDKIKTSRTEKFIKNIIKIKTFEKLRDVRLAMFLSGEVKVDMKLNNFLSVVKSDYSDIFSRVEHSNIINGINVNLRFKFIQFDPNGDLKIELLIKKLLSYFTHYCFSAQKRRINQTPTEQEQNEMYREAQKLFRKWKQEEINDKNKPTSGEMGEMILWLLMEAVLEAPQIVAKMDLKTNRQMESFGSDGIHMKIIDNILNIFFSEAKLYGDVVKAMDSIFESIEKFHTDEMWKHEYNMVTTHYKHLKEDEQEKIFDFINGKIKSQDIKINHACLVGYDWDEYKKLDNITARQTFIDEFEAIYKNDTARLTKLIQSRFNRFSKKQFNFEVFFLPVKSVQELRDKFNEEL